MSPRLPKVSTLHTDHGKASMSRIDFWAIPVLLKRTGWVLIYVITVRLCPILSKNHGHVKNGQYYQNRALVHNGIE